MKQELGVQGAKQQSWVRDNPRALLKRISDENPNADEKTLRALFSDALFRDPLTHLNALIAYWWSSNYRALTEKPQRQISPTRLTQEDIALARSRLMHLVLSNGKALKDCTFGECAKEGGWLIVISRMGEAQEVVGEKLTLDQVAAVWSPPATQ